MIVEVGGDFRECCVLKGASCAFGVFDGVHLGHQMVMKTAMEKAAQKGVKAMVVTFGAHPFSVLCPDKEPARLATVEQKEEYIAAVGIDGLVPAHDKAFAQRIAGIILPAAAPIYSSFGCRCRF